MKLSALILGVESRPGHHRVRVFGGGLNGGGVNGQGWTFTGNDIDIPELKYDTLYSVHLKYASGEWIKFRDVKARAPKPPVPVPMPPAPDPTLPIGNILDITGTPDIGKPGKPKYWAHDVNGATLTIAGKHIKSLPRVRTVRVGFDAKVSISKVTGEGIGDFVVCEGSGNDIRLEDVTVDRFQRYGVYAQGNDKQGLRLNKTAVNNVVLKRFNVKEGSATETPVRIMAGVAVALFDCNLADTFDEGAAKLTVARFHGFSTYAERCNFRGVTWIGPASDKTSWASAPDDVAEFAEFIDCNFIGAVRVIKGIKRLVIKASPGKRTQIRYDLPNGFYSGEAMKLHAGDFDRQEPIDATFENVDFTGKLIFPGAKFINCTHDGKALK